MSSSRGLGSLVFKTYLRALDRHPVKTMCLTTATLHAAGDVIAQEIIEKKEKHDFVRTARFFLLGIAWDGPLISTWYRTLGTAIPSTTKVATVSKVVLDQGLFIPGVLGSFLVLNGILKGMSMDEVQQVLERDYFQLLLANYQLWPAVMLLNFYLMPVRHQVLFTNCVSLIWNTYLSWKANVELKDTHKNVQLANYYKNSHLRKLQNNSQTLQTQEDGEQIEDVEWNKITSNSVMAANSRNSGSCTISSLLRQIRDKNLQRKN